MSITAEPLRERTREALPYFARGWGESGDFGTGKDPREGDAESPLHWIEQIESTARFVLGLDWREKHFYGIVAETPLDVIEQKQEYEG